MANLVVKLCMITNKKVVLITGIVPVLFLLIAWLFFMVLFLETGKYPSYSNPDPKSYAFWYSILLVLFLMLFVSFPLWLITSVRLLRQKTVGAYNYALLGIVAYALLDFQSITDPCELLNWLFD